MGPLGARKWSINKITYGTSLSVENKAFNKVFSCQPIDLYALEARKGNKKEH